MMGMVSAAWAVPEWMKKLIAACTRNIIWAATTSGRAEMRPAPAFSMVSSTWPSLAMMRSARPQAMMKATLTMSLAPVTNPRAIRLGLSPATAPSIRPMARNSAAISSMYHCFSRMPHTSSTMVRANRKMTRMWRTVQVSSTVSPLPADSRDRSMA